MLHHHLAGVLQQRGAGLADCRREVLDKNGPN